MLCTVLLILNFTHACGYMRIVAYLLHMHTTSTFGVPHAAMLHEIFVCAPISVNTHDT